MRTVTTIEWLDVISIAIAAIKVGIITALGANVAGFNLPPAAIFGMVVAASVLTVISTALPAVGPLTAQVPIQAPNQRTIIATATGAAPPTFTSA